MKKERNDDVQNRCRIMQMHHEPRETRIEDELNWTNYDELISSYLKFLKSSSNLL